jgi:S-adenosylmethionine hydrolase
MALITFMSDFGEKDHYVSAVKAKILSINPELTIVDISHNINPFDITHGSFVLRSVFRDFPQGTVHLTAVNSLDTGKDNYLISKIEGHYFISADNGLLSLVSDKDPEAIIKLSNPDIEISVFPSRDIMARSAAMLAGGTSMNELGQVTDEFKKLLGRQLKATKKQISGNVIRVDHFGNAITNIDQEIFNILQKERDFVVKFGREEISTIHPTYASVDPGECFVVFNSNGLLEIGINKGNASELMGLNFDAPIVINFKE